LKQRHNLTGGVYQYAQYVNNILFFALSTGLHRHYAVEDTAQDPDGGPQGLQNIQNPGILHAQGEVHT